MQQQRLAESDLFTPIPTQPTDLILRAAMCAINCGTALEQGDLITATDYLGNLREIIARLDRDRASDRPEISVLRSHEMRLSERLFSGQAPLRVAGETRIPSEKR